MPENQVPQPLPLCGAANVRELGGYHSPLGTTRAHTFLRGAGLNTLTAGDRGFLRDYGVSMVIDLRSQWECTENPDALDGLGAEYVNIHLHDRVNDLNATAASAAAFPPTMGEQYIRLLERSGDLFRAIFERLAACRGCALFHCTAGKDRTGMVAMLLLGLAGVEEEIIVADYAATERYMPDWEGMAASFEKKAGCRPPMHVFRSEPQNMRTVLEYLHTNFGSAEDYLSRAGLPQTAIDLLREKLLKPIAF